MMLRRAELFSVRLLPLLVLTSVSPYSNFGLGCSSLLAADGGGGDFQPQVAAAAEVLRRQLQPQRLDVARRRFLWQPAALLRSRLSVTAFR